MARFGKIMPAFIALAALAAFMFAHERPQAPPAGGACGAPLVSSLSGVNVINVKGNATLWVASSRKAVLSEDGRTARLSDVAINIPAQNARMNASGGKLDLDSYTLTLDGDVDSEVKGFDLKTSSLCIVPGGRMNTRHDNLVVLEKKGIEIRGRGFDANQQKKVRLENNVKAIFY